MSKEKESGSGQVQGKAWKAKRNCKATKAAEETVSMLVAKSMSSLFLLEMGWSGHGEAVNKKMPGFSFSYQDDSGTAGVLALKCKW